MLHHTVKRPFAVLHFSFSSWVKVCIRCKSSHPSQFFITATLAPWKVHALLSRILDTSISKFISSMYLSCVPKLNASFMSTGPLCLCLCGSLWLTEVFSQDPASIPVSAIITAITVGMATWFTSLILSDLALSYLSSYMYFCLLWVTCLPKWDFYFWHHVMLLASNAICQVHNQVGPMWVIGTQKWTI